MLRILLIRTNLTTIDHKVTQPLGLMYLASSLLQNTNNEVKILDNKLSKLSERELLDKILHYKPHIVGLSVLPLEAGSFKKLTKQIKRIAPHTHIVAGGVYPTVMLNDVFKDSSVDFAIIGEGEESMFELVNALGRGQKFPSIPGSAYMKNGSVIVFDKKNYIRDLDNLPMPAWDLIDLKKYFTIPRTFPIYKHKEYMSIFTSRSCPFQCTFCHNVFGKEFRGRSPENVFSEIESLYHIYGVKEIQIIDDCFNFDLDRAKKICDLIIRSNINISITFPNGVRGDIMDKELLGKLRKAGTYAICYGVQSGSKRLQKESKSNIDLNKLSRIVEETDKSGMIAYGYCMIGFPGETKEELYETLNYVKKNKFHGATFFFTTPYPGTELFSKLKNLQPQNNSIKDHVQNDYRYSSPDLSNLSLDELRRFQIYANVLFYFNLKKIMRLIYLLPNKRLLLEIIKVYIKRIVLFCRS